ncbi:MULTISPECIES: hypothetical protein [unclassified Polynucleobacter]|jgi:hypothetical protein|uniref:hypothetical protein n=1 Tax=unclassified Polynucleobacter TaxID=2640945 RepID=UPI000A4859A7|nr:MULTISPECIES: hypothetical protein [unclassified Polynucleobacter]
MMNSLMQTFALLEMSITCSLILIWILQKIAQEVFPFIVKVLLLLILANLFFWPLGMSLELPLAAYVRGVTGDLSIVTTLLLWSTLVHNNKSTPIAVKFVILIIALAFYPLALGLGMHDPYAWGYGSITFLLFVLLLALICGLANWSKGFWIVGLAIIAWSVHWHESANLWDYLLDPFLALWAFCSLFAAVLAKRKEKARSGYLFRPG